MKSHITYVALMFVVSAFALFANGEARGEATFALPVAEFITPLMVLLGVLALFVGLWLPALLYFSMIRKGLTRASRTRPEVFDGEVAAEAGTAVGLGLMFDKAEVYQGAALELSHAIMQTPDLVEPRLELARAFILSNFPDNWRDATLLLEESREYFRDDRSRLIAEYLGAFLYMLNGDALSASHAHEQMNELLASGARAYDCDIRDMMELVTISEFVRGRRSDLRELNRQWLTAHER